MPDNHATETRLNRVEDIKLPEGYGNYLESLVDEVIGVLMILVVLWAVYVTYNFCALQ